MATIAPLPELARVPSTASYNEKSSLDKSSLEKSNSPTVDVERGAEEFEAPPPYDILSGLPLPDVSDELPVETQTLTIRAIIIGCALGCVVQASNLYLGLKTGFTFGPQLFGAIFGFAILKPLSRILPPYLGGGYFGEKENVTVQSAATAAGGLGILFVSGIPAMYQLGLLSASPEQDFGRLIAFTVCCAFFGMAFAIPLRSWYILRMKLVFPTPTATALTIRALHSGKAGAEAAKKKSLALAYSFGGAIGLRVASGYAPGILWDWHPFWWLASWGWKSVIAADNWGFYLEWTPAFLGAGVLSGVNASISLWAGGVFFWGVLGPLLMKYGVTVARDFSEDYDGYAVMNYSKMSFADPKGKVSPRYWILWAGVFAMLLIAFTEIAVQGPTLWRGIKGGSRAVMNSINRARGQEEKFNGEEDQALVDPAKPEDQVPWWAWVSLLIVSCVLSIVVMDKLFNVGAGITILSIFLGFLFSFIGVQSAGTTDINPISTCAKASQLVVGGATHGHANAMSINLLAALISGGAAAQSTDMTGDLKTGHLIKAKPRNQFVAQACGALVSVFLATGLFVLFTKAYPCITDPNADTCQFGIPSVSAWVAVAQATTSTNGLPFPHSAAICALVYGIACVILTVVRQVVVPEKYRVYMPNMMAFSLSAVLPPGNSQFGLAMAIGSLAAHFWKKFRPQQADMYVFPVAAGMIAGEGIGGVVNAILVVAGVDGSIYGTGVGCVANVFCG